MANYGIGYTFDFKRVFFNVGKCFFCLLIENGVLFPEKINGSIAMLSRPTVIMDYTFCDYFTLV